MNTIRAVVFDLYGVLGLNGWQDFKTRHFEGRWDDWEPIRQLGQRVDAGEASEEEFVKAIAEITGETPENVRYQFAHTQPNKELLEYIRNELRPRYKIGLLSNASRDVLAGIFSDDERKLFDAVVMSVSVGYIKPDPLMFQIIAEKLGVNPHEILFVDDQERHLVPAAVTGMTPLHYVSAAQTIEDLKRMLAA